MIRFEKEQTIEHPAFLVSIVDPYTIYMDELGNYFYAIDTPFTNDDAGEVEDTDKLWSIDGLDLDSQSRILRAVK